MPPKAAPAPAAVAKKGLKLSIKATKYSLLNLETSFKIRIISEWLDCCGSTGIFGQDDLAWKELDGEGIESEKRYAIYENSFDPFFMDIHNDTTKIRNFNMKPGIYFIIMKETVENGLLITTPDRFNYIDCSSFLLESLKKNSIFQRENDIEIEIEIEIDKPLLSMEDAILMEPLLLDIPRLNSFPVYEGEYVQDAIQSSYLYGSICFGTGLSRTILGFPQLITIKKEVDPEETTSYNELEIVQDKFNVNLQVCFLPGLEDLALFKESLTSTTFVIEIHKEDLHKRAFHTRNIEEYNSLLGGVKTEEPVVAVKGKAPPKAAAAPAAESSFGPPTPGDSFLLGAIEKALGASRQIRPHGTARFRLEQLLSSSNDLLTKFERRRIGIREGDDNIIVKEEMLLEVRLERPSKPEKWDLPADISLRSALLRNKQEEQSKLDGTLAVTKSTKRNINKSNPPRHELFIVSGTNLELTASLYRKLNPNPSMSATIKTSPEETVPLTDKELKDKLLVTPFTRMIILFKYQDNDTLLAIDEAINKVNKKALPNIQGTIRSYSLTEEELKQSINGSLDLISGYMIIDDDMRLVVVEGLAGVGQGMQSLFVDLPRVDQDNEKLKILCNPDILFPHRLYPNFCPDLRRIRVRDKLKKLARRPEIYNRKQVEEICFEAVDSIMALRRARDLRSTKELDMYPSAESLSTLELLYGEAISRTDMDGTLQKKFVENYEMSKQTSAARLSASRQRENEENDKSPNKERNRGVYIHTDCRNKEFEEYLKTRPEHKIDHIAENRSLRMQAWEDMLKRKEVRTLKSTESFKDIMGNIDLTMKEPKIYLYSTQSLNFKQMAINKLREKVAKDRNASYTYSEKFMSQTISAVDIELDAKKSAADVKNHWLTPSGFQYPKRRTNKELIVHPKRPTDARIDDLLDPFRDQLDVKKENFSSDRQLRNLEKSYQTQIRPEKYFGALEPMTFEREFQLKLVGDRSKLPRGNILEGDKPDNKFFRSVHIGGEAQTKLLEEALLKEKEDWMSKVVVDSTSFKVGGFKVKDKPLQQDRAKDILKDEPKQVALQKLYDRQSHLGKEIGHKPTPITIMNLEKFVQNASQKVLIRQTDHTKFITTKEMDLTDPNARPLDFIKYIHKDTYADKTMAALSTKPNTVKPSHLIDRTGPRWEAPSHK